MDTIPVPVSECEDHNLSESSPIPQFLRSELDNSEVCDDVTASVPVCSDSPKSKGISFFSYELLFLHLEQYTKVNQQVV